MLRRTRFRDSYEYSDLFVRNSSLASFLGSIGKNVARPRASRIPDIPMWLAQVFRRSRLFTGEKISFQPTPNFEFGMGITAMFGGPGLPVTFGNFFDTYYVHTSNLTNNPGKRVSAADFTYRVPGLRNWLTFYMDSMVWDEDFAHRFSSRCREPRYLHAPNTENTEVRVARRGVQYIADCRVSSRIRLLQCRSLSFWLH